MFRAREVILTDSGTSALLLALQATVRPAALVAMPGYACIDIIAAAIGAGVRVALYDVDPKTMTPDADSVRRVLQGGAEALVVAPLYGYPPSMSTLSALASEHGVPLIEDAAQGAGGTIDGMRVGVFGDLSILSFGRGKGTTGGSGGALLIRTDRFADEGKHARKKLPARRRGGREIIALAAQWLLARPSLYGIPASVPALKLGEMVYRAPQNPKAISDTAATVLRSALSLDDAEVGARRRHAGELTQVISTAQRFSAIRVVDGADPGYLRFAILDETGNSTPAPNLGAVRGYPITLDEHSATMTVLDRMREPLNGARVLRDRLFTLPTHSRVTRHDIARIAEWVSDASR
jgi:dTDP-4-amino-4,6-dideoxygalactose transaminase